MSNARSGNQTALRDAVVNKANGQLTAQSGGTGGTIFDLLERQKAGIAKALPNTGMTAERFTRIVTTTVRQNPDLLACEPMSVLAAVMLSAQLGLEPGPLGHAYLVPFRNNRAGGRLEAQFIIGYKGYIDLARRSGNIVSIAAREVCENDEFDFSYGLNEALVHKPSLTDRGEVIAYYGVAHFKDGGHLIHVMSREDVERFRRRSKSPNSPAWHNDYDAMAKKTVIRRMATFLPLSTESMRAINADESAPTELAQDMADAIVPDYTDVAEDDYTVSDVSDATGLTDEEKAAIEAAEAGVSA